MEVLINLGLVILVLVLVLVRGAMRRRAQSHHIVISHILAVVFVMCNLFLSFYWLEVDL